MRHSLPVVLLLLALSAPLHTRAQSIAELEAAARAQPASAEALDRLGDALARQRRFSEAQDTFARALRLAPDAKRIRHHVALAYAWSGNYAEAERHYAELLGVYPRDPELRIDYGQALAWDRKFAEARREYEKVLAQNPRNIDALRQLAILSAWENRYDQALELIARAEVLAPRNLGLLVAKGEVQSWQGELEPAAETLRRALEIDSNDAGIWNQLGQVLLWQGRPRAALDAYRRALGIEPELVEAHIGLSRAYRDNHQFEEAERRLRQALVRFPGDLRIGQELAALAASRRYGWIDLFSLLEPLLFSALLMVLFSHIRHYQRVLVHRFPWIQAALYLLPLLAVTTIALGAFVTLGGSYYREAAAASNLLEILTLAVLATLVFLLIWLLRFERPARGRSVLAIGAHPDDIEFGCGATLLRYCEQGDRAHALILTSGEKGVEENRAPGQRVLEAEASGQLLGLATVSMKNLPDTQLQTRREEIRIAIEDAVRRVQPDIVFTHTAHDLHSDHRAVAEVTREAVRRACTILCYENPNTPPEFSPDYFVDIAEYVEDKVAAIAKHRSQADKPYTNADVIRSAAAFRGAQAKVRFAEAFETVRVLEKDAG